MKKYKQAFEELRAKNEGALIAFAVIGDPDYNTSLEITKKIVDAGANMLELGLAFSDPIADGPTIQKADIRALESGINTDKALDFVKEIRDYTKIPIGLLCYYNLVYQRGIKKFYEDSRKAGVSSILIPDMPIEESDDVIFHSKANGIDTVFMASPLTGDERMEKIASKTTGFVYAVSRLGITGARSIMEKSALDLVKRIKRLTDKPLCVGFGISKPEHVKDFIDAGADGAIVGSAIVGIIAKNSGDKEKMLNEVYHYVRIMKLATKPL